MGAGGGGLGPACEHSQPFHWKTFIGVCFSRDFLKSRSWAFEHRLRSPLAEASVAKAQDHSVWRGPGLVGARARRAQWRARSRGSHLALHRWARAERQAASVSPFAGHPAPRRPGGDWSGSSVLAAHAALHARPLRAAEGTLLSARLQQEEQKPRGCGTDRSPHGEPGGVPATGPGVRALASQLPSPREPRAL